MVQTNHSVFSFYFLTLFQLKYLRNNFACELLFAVTLKKWNKEQNVFRRLIKHGNNRAIVIDKVLLEAAGLSESALFQISVSPSGGLVIQSVDDNKAAVFRENFDKLNKKHKKLMQNLANL